MARSMTGFARRELTETFGYLSCEMRSVNHRYLEPSLRLPELLRTLEPQFRTLLRKHLSRGKVEVSLHLQLIADEQTRPALNHPLATHIAELAKEVRTLVGAAATGISAVDILKWPGVLQSAHVDTDVLQASATKLFTDTLQDLLSNRAREGIELCQCIELRLQEVAQQTEQIQRLLPQLMRNHQDKLRAKLTELKIEVEPERFSQEVVYALQKADVAEELDRLTVHLAEVRHTLGLEGPIGRRLDFLMQELNREANTLSSKSIAGETTQAAVELKVLIEQMREQIQNIE